MGHNIRGLFVVVFIAVAACAGPHEPLYPQVAASIPPVPPDRARIYFYRDYEPYDSLSRANILLNGVAVGVSIPGAVFYRDVEPAAYEISVPTPGSDWRPLRFVARPGETFYVKVESLRAWISGGGDSNYERDTFAAVIIDPAQAQRELAFMRFVQPEAAVAFHGRRSCPDGFDPDTAPCSSASGGTWLRSANARRFEAEST
jgi:hypothetical protein